LQLNVVAGFNGFTQRTLDMQTCETCGKAWPDDYCPECGRTIGAKAKPVVAASPVMTGSPPPISPQRQTPPPIPNRKSRFPLLALIAAGFVVAVVAGLALAYHLKQSLTFPSGFRNTPTAGWGARMGEKEFETADAQIESFNGNVAFGNSAEAIALARSFSKALQAAREASFTTGPQLEVLDKTKGEFLTYCELHSQECAFIVHVPHLRKFDKNVFEDVDARKLLAQIAWLTAQKVLKAQHGGKPGMELAVGLRGISQYGPITIGYYQEDAQTPNDGVVKHLDSGAQTHFLWTFFAPENQPRPH
jgi:hypothetical protein